MSRTENTKTVDDSIADADVFVAIHYCEKLKHWIAYAYESEEHAIGHRGFGDFAGHGTIKCKIPKMENGGTDG